MATKTCMVSRWAVCILLEWCLVTSRKRSLGQGNVFTGVCLSTGHMTRGSASRGLPTGEESGRYASYWNAFLLPPANEVWGKVIFSEACVKNSVQGGGSASVHAGIPHPPSRPGGTPLAPGTTPLQTRQAPPGTRHPPDQAGRHPPPEQSMLGDTANERAVCILLECNLITFA